MADLSKFMIICQECFDPFRQVRSEFGIYCIFFHTMSNERTTIDPSFPELQSINFLNEFCPILVYFLQSLVHLSLNRAEF